MYRNTDHKSRGMPGFDQAAYRRPVGLPIGLMQCLERGRRAGDQLTGSNANTLFAVVEPEVICAADWHCARLSVTGDSRKLREIDAQGGGGRADLIVGADVKNNLGIGLAGDAVGVF